MINYNIESTFIRKRGSNYNVYIEYINEEGKRKQKSLAKYGTKKEAEKHLIDLKSSINNNKFILSKDITFVERYKKYIHDPSRKLSPGTLKFRESDLKTNIEPFFKAILLKDVSPYLLQAYTNYLFDKYTKGSATGRLACVKTVINEAYRLQEMSSNPVKFIKTPTKAFKKDKTIQEPYNKEEIKYLIESLDGSNLEIPVLLMLTMGLRFGEAAGLRWEDIDFKNNTISINQILVYTEKTKIIFKEPKTESSIRTISAPKELMIKLKKWKVKHNEYRLNDILEYPEIVCLNKSLKPHIEPSFHRMFHYFLDKINLRKIRLHDLRHTHATMLVLAGTDFKTISNRLGHTDIRITLNRYSHVLDEMDHKASENISSIMFK